MNNLKPILNNLSLWAMVSLTLGLAPFLPQPHVAGKIRWVLGGAGGMTGMDWFDLLLHLTPWLLLLRILVLRIRHKAL